MNNSEIRLFLSSFFFALGMLALFAVQVVLPLYWSSMLATSSSSVSVVTDEEDDFKNELSKMFGGEIELQEFRSFLAAEFCLENLRV